MTNDPCCNGCARLGQMTALYCDALARLEKAETEVARLQRVIDSRPAINAGLPDSYIKWSQSIYVLEAAHAMGISKN